MQTFQYEGELHLLRKWACNRCEDEPPEPFLSWVTGLIEERVETSSMGYWVGVITPESPLDGDWCRGYPHAHCVSVNWDKRTMTAITWLSIPESGGEFGCGGLDKDDPYEFIDVKPGLTAVVDGATWHGARPVHSGTRIALISTGFPA